MPNTAEGIRLEFRLNKNGSVVLPVPQHMRASADSLEGVERQLLISFYHSLLNREPHNKIISEARSAYVPDIISSDGFYRVVKWFSEWIKWQRSVQQPVPAPTTAP